MDTVREFAERVLFGESLDEKLAPPPANLSDLGRGSALASPLAPSRPCELILRPDGVRAEFPGVGKVETDRERGQLLHFFANHELLATELMALVLLKFPDAPAEFRAGVLKTLKDEQMHTKLYLRRMADCGVEFGELPVNGFFWNLVAPMDTPLDYVTRLSLTFEQANLDYSRGYAQVMKQAGDLDTAAVLERIYHDEINHVHYGLTWFRKWKEEQSDWKAYRSLLHLPLSAARAKGAFEFNEAGRREAGLDEEFIRELRVYAQSKGRTPNVYWFNPGAEESLSGGGVSNASGLVARDLGLLVALVARREDVVMLERVPPLEHLLSLAEAGLELPELVSWADAENVADRKLGEARPWGATPDAEVGAQAVGLPLKFAKKELFSKSSHTSFLKAVVDASEWTLICPPEVIGVPVRSSDELEECRASSAWDELVLKVPFSTAGRDRLRVPSKGEIAESAQSWVRKIFEVHGELVAEPWLDRVLDFSIQYDRRAEGRLVRRGFVILENSSAGRFRRARVTGRIIDELDESSRRKIFAGGGRKGGLVSWLEHTFEQALNQWLAEHEYHGPLGVDLFFYRDLEGDLRLKPVVEVNPRWTMGRVALELDRRFSGPGETVFGIQPATEALPDGSQWLTTAEEGTRLRAYWSRVSRGA